LQELETHQTTSQFGLFRTLAFLGEERIEQTLTNVTQQSCPFQTGEHVGSTKAEAAG
jgi:hypothetical protein